MAKVATTANAILGQVKDRGEYKDSSRDKEILEDILDVLDGNVILTDSGADRFVWPKPTANGKLVGTGKNKIRIPTYKVNKIFTGAEDLENKFRRLDVPRTDSQPQKGVGFIVGDHPVQIISSGASGGLQAAQITRMQELGSAVVFKYVISHNKNYSNAREIAADTRLYGELLEIWQEYGLDVVDMSWLESFYKQQKALISEISKPTVHEYNRENGFMKFISKIVSDEFNISKKDNWDPADIWLIRHEDRAKKIIERIVKKSGTIDEFNSVMRSLFHNVKKDASKPAIYGISLKKVGSGDARIELANHTQAFFDSLDQIHMVYLHTVCDLSITTKDGVRTFGTQDSKFVVENGEKGTYSFQIKANDSKKVSGLKYEPTMKGATAARVGKATVELVVDKMSNSYYGKTFDKASASYPQTATAFEREESKYRTRISNVIAYAHVTSNVKDVDEAIDNFYITFGTQPHVANSKLQQITWLNQILSLPKEKLDSFATDLVFIAKKEGTRYGPFAKIF